jgi:hypothetical protein
MTYQGGNRRNATMTVNADPENDTSSLEGVSQFLVDATGV